MIHRYAELRPEQLAGLLNSPFICPWGALEWHGAHLPLGLDGLVADHFSAQLAEATGGVLLPCTWLPITTLPHALSLQTETSVVTAIWRQLIDQLYNAGARTICLISGHYAQGHELELYRESAAAMARHQGLRVFAASPLELLNDPDFQDHAGRYETSQLLAIRPDLVRADLFQPGPATANAVLGEDPRLGTAAEGERLLRVALTAWRIALSTWDAASLHDFYQKREHAYAPYRETYFKHSWEQAIEDWWRTKSGDA